MVASAVKILVVVGFTFTFLAGVESIPKYLSCDDPVDVIFVFDNKACINLARDVIVHYKSLLMPETKLKFGVAYCTTSKVEHTGPEAGLSHLLMITENLQHSELGKLDHHNTTHLPDRVGIRAENTPYPIYEITDISSSRDSCLKTVGAMFDAHGSFKSMKMVIVVATQKNWADPRHLEEAAALKGPAYNTTMAVIAAGVKSYDSLDILENMASDRTKFMTVTSANDLHDISNKFARGACRLASVDLTTPAFPVETSTIPTNVALHSCEQITERAYEIRTHMGPLGYVMETKYCELGTVFDLPTCSCVAKV